MPLTKRTNIKARRKLSSSKGGARKFGKKSIRRRSSSRETSARRMRGGGGNFFNTPEAFASETQRKKDECGDEQIDKDTARNPAVSLENLSAPEDLAAFEVGGSKTTIGNFRGEHFFLSNMCPCKIQYKEEMYPSVENAFQAAKYKNSQIRALFQGDTPPKCAPKIGKVLTTNPDIFNKNEWESEKDKVMGDLLRIKFSNLELKELLLKTEQKKLIEGTEHDDIWGCLAVTATNDRKVVFYGANKLGKLLEVIRSELQAAEEAAAIARGGAAEKAAAIARGGVFWPEYPNDGPDDITRGGTTEEVVHKGTTHSSLNYGFEDGVMLTQTPTISALYKGRYDEEPDLRAITIKCRKQTTATGDYTDTDVKIDHRQRRKRFKGEEPVYITFSRLELEDSALVPKPIMAQVTGVSENRISFFPSRTENGEVGARWATASYNNNRVIHLDPKNAEYRSSEVATISVVDVANFKCGKRPIE